jgi:hypothetical protein
MKKNSVFMHSFLNKLFYCPLCYILNLIKIIFVALKFNLNYQKLSVGWRARLISRWRIKLSVRWRTRSSVGWRDRLSSGTNFGFFGTPN